MNTKGLILITALALPASGIAGDLIKTSSGSQGQAAAAKAPVYVPPTLKPLQDGTRTQNGATRQGRAPTELRALAPTHTGFTVNPQPTVYWYTSKPIDRPVEIIVETADGALAPPIVDTRLSPPFKAGLHSVSLKELGVSLETGREYAWRVVVVVDEKRRALDVFAGANISRVDMPASLADAIKKAAPGEQPRIYASAGLWYDAMESIEKLGDRAGGAAIADCRSMLDGQSLEDVSCPGTKAL